MKAEHEFFSEASYKKYLRHYYAGVALQGMLTKFYYSSEQAAVIKAWGYADAMIEYMNKPELNDNTTKE